MSSPRSRTPVGPVDLTIAANSVLSPRASNVKTPTWFSISRLYHAASTLAAYASSNALLHSHARLATGCGLGITGRESNPLNSDERFQSVTPNFLLSQALPGARTLPVSTAQRQSFGADF